MAVSATPAFGQAIKTVHAIITGATTVLATTTNHVALLAAALTNGGFMFRASVMPIATCTLTQIVMFRSPDGGTNRYLVGSCAVPAYTLATTTEVPRTYFDFSMANMMGLSPLDTLYVAAGVDTGDFHVSADLFVL